MRFHLYACEIMRAGNVSSGHIVAANEQRAADTIIDHDLALGLTHESFSLERVDQSLPEAQRRGLDALLESAPTCFASWCDLGWVAHTAPVTRLRFFHTTDPRGGDVYAIAPNMELAAALFSNTMLPDAKPHVFAISEGVECLPEEMTSNVAELLELGPVGIAEWDADAGTWFVW